MRRHLYESMKKPAFASVVLLALIVAPLSVAGAANPVDFESQIAPLLEQHCLRCHNHGNAKGKLSLATLADAKRGGESGTAIRPADASHSRLIKMITPSAPGQADMPEDTAPLKPKQINLLRRWIDAGAAWPENVTLHAPSKTDRSWWSLQSLTDAPPPDVSAHAPKAWRDSAIDRFVFRRLADAGLTPNPPADRHTLLRRVTYDLTGLPPTPEQVATFVADRSPAAYAKVVDRLLASPRYGERWGRHWLDVVRFGESVGFEQNYILDNAWPFRDYIIRSFNADKPFDQLVLEHLAGDVIAKNDPTAEIGTAFLVCGPYDTVNNQDAGQAAQIRANTLDEIIRATGETFLGLTIGCARCHDHKFDPIRTDDYYQFYATFAGVKHGDRVIATPRQKREHAAAVTPLQQQRQGLLARRQQIVTDIDAQVIQREVEISAAWTRRAVDRYGTEERFAPIEAKFVRLTVLGRDDNPNVRVNYRIDEFEIFDVVGRNVGLASAGAVARGESRIAEDFAGAYSAALVNDGKFGKRWIAAGPELTIELVQPTLINRVVFSSDRNQAVAQDGKITLFVADYRLHISKNGKIWREVAHSYDRKPKNPKHREVRLFNAAQSAQQRKRIQKIDASVRALNAKIAAVPPLPNWWAGQFNKGDGPFHVFKGGSPQQMGATVTAASPWTLGKVTAGYALPADAPESERRLTLARWIVAPDNPLTPRVLANRLWHYHFGTGIVDTPSDLGFMGGRPTHPAMLDWMARQLMADGWRIKPMHKRIVMSGAYRQSSAQRDDAAKIDAESRLLWRFPPRRLSGEELRDTFLAAADLLDHVREQGGPGFRLYHYFRDNVSTYTPLDKHDPSTYRRAVYHQNARGQLVDLMTEFDCPDPSAAAPRRVTTTTPLQALTLLNHSFTMDIAKELAQRCKRTDVAGDLGPAVQHMHELLGLPPTSAEEQTQALNFAKKHGLVALARVLLNTNALIYLD